jgi:hypothetical protein
MHPIVTSAARCPCSANAFLEDHWPHVMGQGLEYVAVNSAAGGQTMVYNHSDLAMILVEAHQEHLREEARISRQGPGLLRAAIGSGLVRLGELIGGVQAPRVGTSLPNPVALR